MIKLFKNLYKKLKQKLFKIRQPVVEKIPVGEKIILPRDSFNMNIFNNVEWLWTGESYYPFHILNTNGQKYYIPYVSTERIKNSINAGNTIMNKFLITKN